MLKGAIFDIDGTLLDSVDAHGEAWHRAFAQFGHDVPAADARRQIGKGGDKLLPFFLQGEALERDGDGISQRHGELFREEYFPSIRPFADVRTLFQALADRGVRLSLASSAKGEELERFVERLGIGDLLHSATSSKDVERSKPDPDIFQTALDRLDGVDAKDTLVFGDSPYDAEAAAKAGLRTVAVRCGGFPDDDLRAAGAIAVFDDPAELLRRLDTLFELAES
ncbi:HAD family hydrolase [Rhizosaccharibacter radicis]|uniref:HAD family hydrolase n=1 Tax=Rhizosaccharibacter radicis TaxID=2782605 RepID=A0ABT1VWD4_9PROT|nr:HAD family hydrolase [Acetobacteraceae bacterium KSS12]